MRAHTRQLQNLIGGTSQRGRIQSFLYFKSAVADHIEISAGPIIEQGTHFCDLSRYFGGEVDISSVQAHSLEWHENAGRLSKMSIDESNIASENRIPRVTAATW